MTTRPGSDYLGGNRFKKAMLAAHPQNWCGGIFLDTFGYALTTIRDMCASEKFSEIVVHMAPFDSTHRYPVSKLMPYLRTQAGRLEKVSKQYPKTVLMLSPFCESNHPASVMRPVLREVQKLAPSCLMVNSIWRCEEVDGFITEIHLPNNKPVKIPSGEYTVSADGFGGDGSGDFPDTDVSALLRRYAGARHFRWWNFRCNGKFGHNDTTPIKSRKMWPDEKYLKGHHAMMDIREGSVSWPKSALYKPFADDHGNVGVTKDNHAMVIAPSPGWQIEILDRNGKVIDKMNRFGDPHIGTPKGNRYYSSLYAYQIADKAQANTGSRMIQVRAEKTIYPLTDGDLRSGYFK